jgi:O-antigen/teichoic acid export membrane protein
MQLAAPIHSVTSAALSIVFPMVSRRQSNDSKLSLNKLSVYILIANVVICSITAGFILIFGNTILSFWLGIGYPQEIEGVLRYLTFAFWILALNITPYNILLGLGKMKSTSVIVIASGAVGLLPIYFGCLWYGLIGATVGKIIFALLALTLFYPLSRELFKSAKLQ